MAMDHSERLSEERSKALQHAPMDPQNVQMKLSSPKNKQIVEEWTKQNLLAKPNPSANFYTVLTETMIDMIVKCEKGLRCTNLFLVGIIQIEHNPFDHSYPSYHTDELDHSVHFSR